MSTKNECCPKCHPAFSHDGCEETPCIPYKGTKTKRGYGVLTVRGIQFKAHVLAVLLDGRKYPKGYVTDHLCRNTSCINPKHLEVVTNAENVLRGESVTVKNKAKDTCMHGHNNWTYTPNRKGGKNPWRACLDCRDIVSKSRYKTNRNHNGK